MSRGERVLWTVPAVVAIQQLVVAWPGDSVYADPAAGPLLVLFVLALTRAAATRRSRLALGVLVAYAVAMVLLPAAIVGGADVAVAESLYLFLGLVAVGLLLWPSVLVHVASKT